MENYCLKDYPYIKGSHCASTSICEISNYYGNNISEAIAFGLGSGAYFSCVSFKSYMPRFINTRSPMYEYDFFRNIEYPSFKWNHGHMNFSWSKLEYYLDKGIPVLMHTDIFYLEFYNANFSNIGPHTVVVTGSSNSGETFYISDYIRDKPCLLNKKSLYLSICKKMLPFHKNKIWAPVNFFKIDLERAIKRSIFTNSKRMLDSNNNYGINNIKKTSEEIKHWDDLPNWEECCIVAYKSLEKIGSGGCGFRTIYKEFILESASYFSYYSPLIEPIKEIEKLYKKISNCFLKAGRRKDKTYLKKLQNLLQDLYLKELDFWTLAYNITIS